FPKVGITVSDATITLRVTAAGPDEATCLAAMGPTLAIIRSQLGSLVFGEEDDELQHVVARLLAERGQTLALAEWATEGRIAEWLTQAGASQVVGSNVIAGAEQLAALVGPEDLAAGHTARASATAVAMATRVRERYGATL